MEISLFKGEITKYAIAPGHCRCAPPVAVPSLHLTELDLKRLSIRTNHLRRNQDQPGHRQLNVDIGEEVSRQLSQVNEWRGRGELEPMR